MPYPTPSAGPSKITYDTKRIREVGKKAVKDAAEAQSLHDNYMKNVIDDYVLTTPATSRGSRVIKSVLKAHARRIGQRNGSSQLVGSYDWQVQMGNTLIQIADWIDMEEQGLSNSFRKGIVPK